MGPRELAKRILRSRGIIYKEVRGDKRDSKSTHGNRFQSKKINLFESVSENDSGLTVLKFMGAKGAIIGGSNLQIWILYGWVRKHGISLRKFRHLSLNWPQLGILVAQAALTTLIGQNLFGVTWC